MNKLELLKRLRNEEETILLELLNVTSDDLVDAFLDKIYERYDYIERQYPEDSSET
jgi:hypothetical protein